MAIDLFAGAGGTSLGLARAGFEVRAIELDRDACATHRRNVGPCKLVDVRHYQPPRRAALVAGSPPCTTFSQAGKQEGESVETGTLWREHLRVAVECQAQAILLENVVGFPAAKVALAFESAGYHVSWRKLDSADYGVPQSRTRVFLVGFRDPAARARWQWPMPTHAPPGDLFFPPYRTVRQALGLRSSSPEMLGPMDRPSPTITANEHKAANDFGSRGATTRPRHAGERIQVALRRASVLDRPAPCVRPNAYHEGPDTTRPSRRPMAVIADELATAGLLDRPSATVSAGGVDSGGGAVPFANAEYRRRLAAELTTAGLIDRPGTTTPRLGVRECAALQGFPPGFVFTGTKGSQHKQVGNAVPPAVAEALGRAILAALGVS
jgi:DNA (cytosine-5)-methyltransferase 1